MSIFADNLERANAYLERFKSNLTGHYINGEMTQGYWYAEFENYTPVDNSPRQGG